ncbi:MAG: hypothetical protein M3Y54_06770 [Bacteroidota bacterium]|nr:hypothetical protein [Bacteroidota bacterium]
MFHLRLKICLLFLLFAHRSLAQQEATLDGHLAGHESDSVIVSWRTTPLDEREHTIGVLPDRHGDFQLRIPLSSPLLVQLSAGNADTPVFLEPGDALRLKLDPEKEVPTFRFQPADGKSHAAAATANNYLAEFSQRFIEDPEFQLLPNNIRLKEDEFLSFLTYRHKQQLAMLHGLGQDKVTPVFREFAEAEIRYTDANDHLTYPELKAEAMGNEVMPVGPNFYGFLNDPELLSASGVATSLSPQYQDFGLNYVHQQVRKAGPRPTDVGYYPACYQLAGQRLQGQSRAVVQGLVVRETIRNGHVAHAEVLLADFAAHGAAPAAWVQPLREQLAAHRAQAIGSPAPPLPIGLRSLAGDTVQLARYAGNLVYLLLWDTRLPAGQREIVPLKRLVAQFAGQPIRFVALALDEDAAVWHRLIATDPPVPGVQVLVPPTAGAALRAAYDPTMLPAAVLLAEDGTILHFHARRPSHLLLPDDIKAAFGRAAAYRAVKLP